MEDRADRQTRVVIGVLGGVEAWLGDQLLAVGHARQRSVLAVLAVEADRVVPVGTLIDRVWDERPPYRARSTLRTYLTHLRRALGRTGVAIAHRGEGYILETRPDAVDLHRFRRLLADAREHRDPDRALALVEDALELWRGEPLAELGTSWAQSFRERLRGERAAAEADRIDWALACGRHHELLPELTARAEAEPLDERVAGQSMLALYRSGRQAEALRRYRHIRRHLAEEVGTDPGPALQDLHQRILTADPNLAPTGLDTGIRTATDSGGARQLPAAPRSFTGRADHLAALSRALLDYGTAVISTIGGAGGIGKTWLALAWAHHHIDRFPDGQLFVDLRGFSPDGPPVDPSVAVHGFLDALGVARDRIPAHPNAKIALFRSLVSDRNMLILLDNAATTDQVVPLLPGSSTCTVVVTSRNRLPGLVTAHGAHHVDLDVLTDIEARTLLTGRLGAERVVAEPTAVADLIELCDGFPLALGIVAARAHIHSDLPLAEIVTELSEVGLDALDGADPTASLSAVLSGSYRVLPPEQRRMFALLGIMPGPDIGLQAAASLTGLPTSQAKALLNRLVETSLIRHSDQGRYRMHDLIRRYALDTAQSDLTGVQRDTALKRVVDYYVHTVYAAARLVDPHSRDVAPGPCVPGCVPEHFDSEEAAWSWFRSEHACVLAAQDVATRRGDDLAGWLIGRYMTPFHYLTGDLHRQVVACRTALLASTGLDDPVVHSDAQRFLGSALCAIGRHDEGMGHLQQALEIARRLGDHRCLARTHEALALAWNQQGQHDKALRSASRGLEFMALLHNPVWHAATRSVAALSAARLGLHDLATAHCLAALPVQRERRDHYGEAQSLFVLGLIARNTGDHEGAVLHFGTSLRISREHADAYLEADTLEPLGDALIALGRHPEACEQWHVVAALYKMQGRDTDAARVQQKLDEVDSYDILSRK